MPAVTRRATVTGTVRFAYHDGRGRGCGEIILTNATMGRVAMAADLTVLCEGATAADLAGIRGKRVEMDWESFKVDGRTVGRVVGVVVEFPF